jgi:hypothetical protein
VLARASVRFVHGQIGLQETELERGQCGTIRLKLLNIGA